MQIQSYQAIQTTASAQTTTDNNHTATVKAELPTVQESVQVSISAQAQLLAQADKGSSPSPQSPPTTLPISPGHPLTGEKLQQAVQFKKAQLHYQATADMVNLMTGNSNGVSVSGAYYLSKNEEARGVVLAAKAQQQNLANMQSYQEQTKALNERYS
jgi:hypothetical protein